MRGVRSTTVVALAIAVGSMGATSAFASTATPTSLTLKAAHTTVAPKHRDSFTATLKAGTHVLAGQTVTLYEKKPGAKTWTKLTSKQTNSKGQATYSVVPAGTKSGQKDEFEVKYAGGKIGTKTYAASHSKIVTVTLS